MYLSITCVFAVQKKNTKNITKKAKKKKQRTKMIMLSFASRTSFVLALGGISGGAIKSYSGDCQETDLPFDTRAIIVL